MCPYLSSETSRIRSASFSPSNMNLVQPALRRPFTLVVVVIALVLGAVLALRQMPRDIFPTLGIPTIYVAQPYGGMDPAQMEGFLTYYYEYHFLYITGIEHVESKSIQGAAIIKLQFYSGTDMSQAMSETVAYVNRARAFMPPGTVPPFIMRFDAGSVPVGNLVFSSETRTVGQLQDAALNLVRPLFATLPGVSAPPPFGGSARAIVVTIKPDRLRACDLSPDDAVKVSYEFDQSPYVTRAINGLTLEGALGTVLSGLMVLLFLRDWRSAVIVVINIPLSLLAAVFALWLTGQTINLMTLGGLALAVGILVDMSTVAIENIHSHLARRRTVAA